MDVIFRLRVVFWVLILSLWGLILKQFLFEEAHPRLVAQVRNPIARAARATSARVLHELFPPAQEPLENFKETVPRRDLGVEEPRSAAVPPPSEPSPSPVQPAPATASSETDGDNRIAASPGPVPGLESRPLPPSMILPVAPPGARAPAERAEERPAPPPEAASASPEAPPAPARSAPPPGFHEAETAHFVVFDQDEPDPKLLDTLESLQANLMIDLASFAPWAREERVTIYLFGTQEAYQRATGRPGWSGGASSLSRRTLYAYKSDELVGILAHELTHIYFDGFFKGGHIDPLWLSEGMATLIQTERGLAAPNWLEPNLRELEDGGGYDLDELMKVETTARASDDAVRLWYTESYSVVRFLLRLQRGPSFYRFCRLMKGGEPLNRALLDAYGMPFNRVKALELAWRYDLEKKTLTAREPGSAL